LKTERWPFKFNICMCTQLWFKGNTGY